MAMRSEREVILEHALRDEDNLSAALLIGAAYEELCRRVVTGFLEVLEPELAPRLGPQWQLTVCRDPELLATGYTTLVVARFLPHPGQFEAVLAADEAGYPKYPYLAVRLGRKKAIKNTALEKVKKAIDEGYTVGKVGDPSIWYKYADKAYGLWGSPDVLVRLYRKGEAVAYYAGQLEHLARALEKALGEVAAP